jgi:GTP-binding protein HflX
LFISAKHKTNLEEFKAELYEKVKGIHSQRFPYNDYLYDSDWTQGIQE